MGEVKRRSGHSSTGTRILPRDPSSRKEELGHVPTPPLTLSHLSRPFQLTPVRAPVSLFCGLSTSF